MSNKQVRKKNGKRGRKTVEFTMTNNEGQRVELNMVSGADLPRISACMIVRDEELTLARCLDSFLKYVDELVVFDTGSVDATLKILKQYAKRYNGKVKIHKDPWTDDFSYHRNKSMQAASGDWLFIIDADETLEMPDKISSRDLRMALASLPEKIAAMAILMLDVREGFQVGKHSAGRFLRTGRVEYRGLVHNSIQLTRITDETAFNPHIVMKHYGYEGANPRRAFKLERTVRLLHKQLEDPEQNLHTEFYLAQAYGMQGQEEEVIEWGYKYLNKLDQQEIPGSALVAKGFYASIYYVMARHLSKAERYVEAQEMLVKGLQQMPDDPDLYRTMSDIGVLRDDLEMIVVGARRFVQIYSNGSWQKLLGHPLFHVNPDCFTLMLYRMAVVRLTQAASNLFALQESFNEVGMELVTSVLNDIVANIDGSRLFEAMKILPLDPPEIMRVVLEASGEALAAEDAIKDIVFFTEGEKDERPAVDWDSTGQNEIGEGSKELAEVAAGLFRQ